MAPTSKLASDWLTMMLICVPDAAIVPGTASSRTFFTAGVRRGQPIRLTFTFWCDMPHQSTPACRRPAMKKAMAAKMVVSSGVRPRRPAGMRQRFSSVGAPAERMKRSSEFSTPENSAAMAMKVR